MKTRLTLAAREDTRHYTFDHVLTVILVGVICGLTSGIAQGQDFYDASGRKIVPALMWGTTGTNTAVPLKLNSDGTIGGGGGGGAGDASAANQTTQIGQMTSVIAAPGATPSPSPAKAVIVQGIAGGTAVIVSGPLTDAQLRASAVPISSTQLPAALDGANLKVHEQGTVPVTGTFWQTTQPVNVSQINGVTPLMGAGNTGTGSPRVTIATDQAAVPISAADGAQVSLGAKADSAATTDTGTFSLIALFKRALQDQTSLLTNTTGLSTAAKQSDGSQKSQVVDNSGNVVGSTGNALDVNIKSGGAAQTAPSLFRSTSQGATKAQIDSAAGGIFGYNFVNPNTYPVYAKFYNALSTNVTVGSTTPLRTIAIPGGGSGGGYLIQENVGVPITAFSTALTIAITKNLADSDATALDTAALAEISYK